ncbi:MAG: hypothetical protein ACO1NQ_04165 [Flavobacteriales bacterium]
MNATYTSLSLYGLLCIASVVALSAFGPAGTTAPPPALMPGPDVKAAQLACAVNEFATHVRWVQGSDTTAVTTSTHRFTVGSYKEMLNAGGCTGTAQQGFMIRFGARPQDKALRFAYQLVCMDLAWKDDIEQGPYTPIEDLYETNAQGELTRSSMTVAEWSDGPSKAFQDHILVDRYDEDLFTKVYAGVNAHILFRVSTINALIADNSLEDDDLIEVVPIAEPLAWISPDRGADLTVRTCLVAVDEATGQRLINDSPSTWPRFKNQGCDLGTGCPPGCDVAIFTSTGVALRKGC